MRLCPRCGFEDVRSTPLAGPDAEFYCPTCDNAFTTGKMIRAFG